MNNDGKIEKQQLKIMKNRKPTMKHTMKKYEKQRNKNEQL